MSYSKYRNERYRGYASKREAQRAADLDLLTKVGAVREVKEQVDFELLPKFGGMRAIKYRADFVFDERQNDGSWTRIVEDSKGMKTQVYLLKKRMMLQLLGIRIREV